MSTKAKTYDSNRDTARPAALMTADEVLDALEDELCALPGTRLLLREFPLSNQGRGRIDGLLVELNDSRTYNLTALEVKVDRADFERELKHPEKRARAMAIADQFYFAAPDGLIEPEEIPDDCGLMTLAGGAPIYRKQAPLLEPGELDWAFVRHLMKRVHEKGIYDAAARLEFEIWNDMALVIDAACSDEPDALEIEIALEYLQKALQRHGRNREVEEVRDARARLGKWI